jgi:hypothetical protein
MRLNKVLERISGLFLGLSFYALDERVFLRNNASLCWLAFPGLVQASFQAFPISPWKVLLSNLSCGPPPRVFVVRIPFPSGPCPLPVAFPFHGKVGRIPRNLPSQAAHFLPRSFPTFRCLPYMSFVLYCRCPGFSDHPVPGWD